MTDAEEVPEIPEGALRPSPCIVCGFEPEPAFMENDCIQPYGATMFSSGGNYGSTVFDPMSGYRRLHINVCDNCLRERKDCVRYFIESPRESTFEIRQWNPEEEEGW